ncbi:MAG TPA: DUF5677 domain-containing protein [Terriglobales bacterium]|nr:DUF5677 domain-containing protein [Terriglobales bacterium]
MPQFTVGGVQFDLTREDVDKKLRSIVPEPVRELFVEVNGNRFPIKQALSEVAGLQRGMFTSHDAMRVFRKLGIPIGPIQLTDVERFFTVLKSLNEFDGIEVQGVLAGQLSRSPREDLVYGLYLRARANVQSLLSLKQVMDFQAIVMLARNLFELAIDVKLINLLPNAVERFTLFAEVEKLRAAEKIVAYKAKHPTSKIDTTIVGAFIASNKTSIEAKRATLWPETLPSKGHPKGKPLTHWSGMNLRERTAKLGHPFDEVYEVKYPQMSWYTHSAGLTGFDLKRETYPKLAGIYFELAAMCYMALLTSVIEEFKLAIADDKIKSKMRYAQLMPFTDTDEQVQAL